MTSPTRLLCDGCDQPMAWADAHKCGRQAQACAPSACPSEATWYYLCARCVDLFNDYNPRTWPRMPALEPPADRRQVHELAQRQAHQGEGERVAWEGNLALPRRPTAPPTFEC